MSNAKVRRPSPARMAVPLHRTPCAPSAGRGAGRHCPWREDRGEQVAMHTFQRRPGHEGILPGHIEQRGQFHHQEGPRQLPAAEAQHSTWHRAGAPGRAFSPCAGGGASRRSSKASVSWAFLTEAILKNRVDVHVFFTASMRARGVRISNCLNSWVDAPSDAKRHPVAPKARKSATTRAPPRLKLLLGHSLNMLSCFCGTG